VPQRIRPMHRVCSVDCRWVLASSSVENEAALQKSRHPNARSYTNHLEACSVPAPIENQVVIASIPGELYLSSPPVIDGSAPISGCYLYRCETVIRPELILRHCRPSEGDWARERCYSYFFESLLALLACSTFHLYG
jgi:hypothetical protein